MEDADKAAGPLTFVATGRGFARAEFTDRYGSPCSIQKSSIAFEDCIWLGCDHETFDDAGTPCGARMHLTQELAAALLGPLTHFVNTGELPSASASPPTATEDGNE